MDDMRNDVRIENAQVFLAIRYENWQRLRLHEEKESTMKKETAFEEYLDEQLKDTDFKRKWDALELEFSMIMRDYLPDLLKGD